jgi:hypothetical protein
MKGRRFFSVIGLLVLCLVVSSLIYSQFFFSYTLKNVKNNDEV